MNHTSLRIAVLLGALCWGPALFAEEPAATPQAPVAPKNAPAEGPVALPGTAIIGNKELPVGLDFVPWRPSGPGAVSEGPTQLFDEPMAPIDPEVFRRQIDIYHSTRQ